MKSVSSLKYFPNFFGIENIRIWVWFRESAWEMGLCVGGNSSLPVNDGYRGLSHTMSSAPAPGGAQGVPRIYHLLIVHFPAHSSATLLIPSCQEGIGHPLFLTGTLRLYSRLACGGQPHSSRFQHPPNGKAHRVPRGPVSSWDIPREGLPNMGALKGGSLPSLSQHSCRLYCIYDILHNKSNKCRS